MKQRIHKKLNILLVSIALLLVMAILALAGIFDVFSFARADAHAEESLIEVPEAAFTKPTTLEELRAAKPEDVATLSSYDARDYGLITEVKNQGSEGICWSFATISACETSLILKGLATADSIDLNERNLAYNMVNSPDNVGADDNWNAGNWMYSTASLFTQWRGLNDQNVDFKDMSYGTGDYILTGMISVDNNIQAIKTAVAKYGSVTFAFNSSEITNYYYTPNAGSSHAVTIIGWDDNMSRSKFTPGTPTNDGAWIIKNSRGTWNGIEGYHYFSYELPITGLVTFECDYASEYDHNYYNETSNWSCYTYEPTMPQDADTPKVGNIYKVESYNSSAVQVLKAVNIGANITYNTDTNFKIEVYTGLSPYTKADPTAGTLRSTTIANFTYSGYHTVNLDEPVDLQTGDYFSVVVSYASTSAVYRDTYSDRVNGFSSLYWTKSSGWRTTYSSTYYNAARIKAWTVDVGRGSSGLKEKDLSNATVTVEGNCVYNGSEQRPLVTVKIDGKTLNMNTDYTVSYKNNVYAGTATVTVKGTGTYGGEKSATFTIAKAKLPPNAPVSMIVPEDESIGFALPYDNWVYANETQYENSWDKSKTKTLNVTVNYTGADKANYEKTSVTITLTKGTTGSRDLDGNKVNVTFNGVVTYNGTAQLPDITVTFTTAKGVTTVLTEGVDYVWEDHKYIEVGDYYTWISGIGTYTGYRSIEFSIVKATLDEQPDDVTIAWDADVKDIRWPVGWSLKNKNVKIAAGSTETVTLIHDNSSNYTNPEVQVKITREVAPDVARISINECDVVLSSYVLDYTGDIVKPDVTVTHKGYTLKNGVDYILTYDNNIKVGTAKVTIKGIADFTDSIEKTYTVNAANCNHSYAVNTTKVSTCTEEGCRTYTCTKCGYSYDVAVAQKAHTAAVRVEAVVEATCGHAGSRKETVYCSVCATVISTNVITTEKLDHTAGATVRENVVDATCTTVGGYDEVVRCTVCDGLISSTHYEIAKLPHTEATRIEEIEATCQHGGGRVETVYCLVCDTVIDIQNAVIGKLDHTAGTAENENVIDSTCTKTGSYDVVVRCTECNEILSSTHYDIDKKAHTEVTKVEEVAATCVHEGNRKETVYCSVCDTIIGVTNTLLEKLGHTAGLAVRENVVDATCTKLGSYDEVVHCTVCDEVISSYSYVILKTAHTEATKVEEIAATCEHEGVRTETVYCSVCDTLIGTTDTPIEKLPHTKGTAVKENIVAATCIKLGSYDDVVRCTVCDEIISSYNYVILKTDHTKITRVDEVAATCEHDGIRTETVCCSVCNEVFDTTQSPIEKLGHTVGTAQIENVVEATCSHIGSYDVVVRCSECNMEMGRTEKIVEQIPHNYVEGICTDCGDRITPPVVTKPDPDPDESQNLPVPGNTQDSSGGGNGGNTTVILAIAGLAAVFAIVITVTIAVVVKKHKSGKAE